MDYRQLEDHEPFEPGDWWVFVPTGPDDRMTFTAPEWFIHPTLGRCFRLDRKGADWFNDLIDRPEVTVYRQVFEDF